MCGYFFTSGRLNEMATKPQKTHVDFPLFAHAGGSWAKKIACKIKTLGGWKNDPKGVSALAKI